MTNQLLLDEPVKQQTFQPIDFAHWSLLVGIVLLIPQTMHFPNRIFSYIGIPLVLIGNY